MAQVTQTEAWKALQAHHEQVKGLQMRDLFKQDAKRFDKFHLRFKDVLFDFSKNRVTEETMKLLYNVARARDVLGFAKRMFSGEKINTTEDRAVLHVALRNRSNTPI